MKYFKNSTVQILNRNIRFGIVHHLRMYGTCDSREVIALFARRFNTSKQRVSGIISAMNRYFHSLGIVVHKPHKQSDLFLISNMANNCATQI